MSLLFFVVAVVDLMAVAVAVAVFVAAVANVVVAVVMAFKTSLGNNNSKNAVIIPNLLMNN